MLPGVVAPKVVVPQVVVPQGDRAPVIAPQRSYTTVVDVVLLG